MTLEAGARLGHYRIIALLGRGGMADVYRAEDERLGREVALKAVPPEFARDPERVERFEREVRAAARLTHPNIVTVYEFGQGAGQHFYTMALMPGGDLKARIRAHPDGMPPAEARAVAAAMARALDYAHRQGFVHRDVKPENILFGEDGAPQLTDFGIARAISSGTRMTATGMSIGSPHYMSPEQARGQAVDGRSDLYSLGVVLYEMLTGRVPFDAADTFAVGLSHINDPVPELPPAQHDWQRVVDRLLAKAPDDRFASAADLAKILASDAPPQAPATRVMPLRREAAAAAPSTESVRRLATTATTRRGPLAALAGAALALAVVGIGYVALQDAAGPERQSPTGGGGSAAVQPAAVQPAPIPTPPSDPENPFDVEDREEEPSNDGGADTEVRAPPPPPAPASPPLPPPAPEPVLGGGALLVAETTPPGAEVLVDGELVGETPLERADIRAGVREVTLRHPHYEPVRIPDRNFEDGVALRVERVLTRGAGRLTVTATPRDAWVEVDGQRLAERTPVTLEDLPAGTVQLTVGAAEHRPLTVAVDIPRDGLARLEPALEPIPFGSLTLDLEPADATVTLAGAEPPYRPGVRLPEGAHRVVVSREGYSDVTRTVDVSGDTRVRIALDIEPRAGTSRMFNGIQFVWVPAGEFRMGSTSRLADDDEQPVRQVRISQGFWLGKHEVTQVEWQRVMGSNPSHFDECGPTCPVERVSWNDAQEFIGRLNARGGGNPYRLPSEAEWEYAARAGTETATYAGALGIRGTYYARHLDGIAWYGGNSGVNYQRGYDCSDWEEKQYESEQCGPHAVGRKAPNAWGLYDMLGNVWEWVQDCWHDNYEGAPGDGSLWISGAECGRRVMRGGSWLDGARFLRSADRGWNDAGFPYSILGFRVARTLD